MNPKQYIKTYHPDPDTLFDGSEKDHIRFNQILKLMKSYSDFQLKKAIKTFDSQNTDGFLDAQDLKDIINGQICK